MNNFSFKNWLNSFGSPFYWEAVKDMSSLPYHNIDMKDYHSDNDEEEEEPSDFEEEDFDYDAAESECENAGDNLDVSDYLSEPYYDDPDDDPDFEGIPVEDWEIDNPEPEKESFGNEEEYLAEKGTWDAERREVESDYRYAIKSWKREMQSRLDSAYEDAEEGRSDARDECVEEKRREHRDEQQRRREEYERNVELLGQHGQPDEVKPDNDGYDSQFQVGDQKFSVELRRNKKQTYQGIPIPNVFNITFHNDSSKDGWNLSRKNSAGKAREIYNHLLAAVTKAVQTDQSKGVVVNGFTFSAYEKQMDLIYQRFYKDYLQPSGFIRVKYTEDEQVYLRKDFIRNLMSKIPPEDRRYNYDSIIQTNRNVKSTLQKVKEDKSQVKLKLMKFQKAIGKIVYVDNGWGSKTLAYIISTGPNSERRDDPNDLFVFAAQFNQFAAANGWNSIPSATKNLVVNRAYNIFDEPVDTNNPETKKLVVELLQAIQAELKKVNHAWALDAINPSSFQQLLRQFVPSQIPIPQPRTMRPEPAI